MKKLILFLSIVLMTFLASAVLDDNLNAYYDYQSTSGELIDIAKGVSNGTVNTSITRGANGIIKNAFQFHGLGSGSIVNISSTENLNLYGNFTINTWVNHTSATPSGAILYRAAAGGDVFQILSNVSNSGNHYQFVWRNDADTEDSFTAGRTYLGDWVMLTVSGNGTNINFFINGTLANSTTYDSTLKTGSIDLFIGAAFNSNFMFNGTIDETGLWNRTLTNAEITELYSNGNGKQPFPPIRAVLNSPPNNTAILGNIFNVTGQPVNTTLVNATINIWYANGTLLNETTNSLTGIVNNDSIFEITNLEADNFQWNALICALNDTGSVFCDLGADSNLTFFYQAQNYSAFYNATTYETAAETYTANFTIPETASLSSALFIYNGTHYTSTLSNIAGNNYTSTYSLDIETVSAATNLKNLVWELVYENGFVQNISHAVQRVNAVSLYQCVAANNLQYINFTFINETDALEPTNATANYEWNYYLGNGVINKTLTNSSTEEKGDYGFCFTPENRSVNVRLDFDYNNEESQQRTYRITEGILTNSTTEVKLYLLPTALGLFTRFKTLTNNGDVISTVLGTVTRTISGTSATISSDYTDSSGLVTFFLNPDYTYDFVFSKPGYVDNSFSVQPSSAEIYNVIMGSAVSVVGNGSVISQNTTYSITPINSTLNNNTVYTFGFLVNSSEDISFISMNLTNSSGFQINYTEGSSAGFLSFTADTGNYTRLIGSYIIQTDDETINLRKIWNIGPDFIGEYSLFRQLSLFNDYEFSDFIRMLIVIAVLTGLMIFMSKTEVVESSESKIIVMLLAVWAFSIVGWLDTGLVIHSANPNIQTLSRYSSQYSIAILSSFAGAFFLLRRLFT